MIVVVTFCPLTEPAKAFVQRHLEEAFAQPVVWQTGPQASDEADPMAVLQGLASRRTGGRDRVLGIGDGPLEKGAEAGRVVTGGPVALISIAQLLGGRFRLAEQLAALAVHALGHAYGLGHCDEPDCAMNAAETPQAMASLVPHLGWRCRLDLAA